MILSNWTLPAPEGVPFGLLAAARPIPVPWTRGIDFLGGQCLTPEVFGPCSPPDLVSEGPSNAQFEPVGLSQGVVCSTLGLLETDLEKLALQALEVRAEYLLGLVLETSTNPDLSGGTDLGGFSDVASAIAYLDYYLGQNLYGEQGVVHMNPGFLALLGDAGYRDGGIYRTAGGHRIAASPGYQAVDTIYATGPVFAAHGSPSQRTVVDRDVNTSEAFADEAGIVVFDPCLNVNVEVPALGPDTSP